MGERKEQERLSEVKKKEREASQTVKQLETELQAQYAEHQKETELANREIKELKEELQKNKTISEIEFKFEEKKMRAREQALLRIHAQMEKKLLEELECLKEAEEMETTVHERAQSYLEEKLEEKQEEKKKWENDYDRETNEREVDLAMLKDKRAVGYQELKELDEKKCPEAAM